MSEVIKGRVLLVDDEEILTEILQIILEGEINGIEVVLAKSGNEAIKKLENEGPFDCIICDYNMPDGNGGVVFNYNQQHNKIPLLLLTGGFIEDYDDLNGFTNMKDHYVIAKPIDEGRLISTTLSVLQSSGQEGINIDPHTEKRPVRMEYICRYLNQSYDIYLKLSEQNKKYVKVLNSNEPLNEDVLRKYLEKGEKFVYLDEKDYRAFSSTLLDLLEERVEHAQTEEEFDYLLVESLKFLHDSFTKIGISDKQIEFIDHCVIKVAQRFKGASDDMDHALKCLFKDRGYLLSHSITALHLSFSIAKMTGYGSENVLEKLTYACLLHDILLEDSDLSQIFAIEQAEELDQLTFEKVKKHPTQTADVFAAMKAIPSEVLTMIREHHEKPNGEGFPRGLSANHISPLSGIFIIALKVADHLYHNDFNYASLNQLKNELELQYGKGHFRKPVEAFIDYFKL